MAAISVRLLQTCLLKQKILPGTDEAGSASAKQANRPMFAQTYDRRSKPVSKLRFAKRAFQRWSGVPITAWALTTGGAMEGLSAVMSIAQLGPHYMIAMLAE